MRPNLFHSTQRQILSCITITTAGNNKTGFFQYLNYFKYLYTQLRGQITEDKLAKITHTFFHTLLVTIGKIDLCLSSMTQ